MKYDYVMKICNCGRIHMIPQSKLDSIFEKKKSLMLICSNCGENTIISGEKIEDGKSEYLMSESSYVDTDIIINALDFSDTPEDNRKSLEEIYYSRGIAVPMKSGGCATEYVNGVFKDDRSVVLDCLLELVTLKDVKDFIKIYEQISTTVDMKSFISSTPDYLLEEISKHYIKSFNWSGTKWKKLFN